ncbi:MAG: hypothetical protein CMK07_12385 [Ponticaulis sp.]|nr:hypothetical protein [Ponticaulis sp.]
MGDWMPDVAKEDIAPLVSQLASERSVSDDLPSHPRLHIWGPLEARLQTCDRLILSGLNEGTWPEQPGTDGFIPRHIRAAIGLPDTEARIGLSAHDFAQLACTPNVVLTRSLRVNDKPAVASRWLWRLRILASGALKNLEAADDLLMADSAHLLDWARALQNTKSADPVHPPKPLPPSEARSRYISVTDVENLIRDPYAFYAGSILKLSPLEALDAPLNPQSIGTAIHAALEGFDTLNRPYTRPDEIIASFAEQLREVGADDLFILEREPGWEDVAKGYLDWMVQRDGVVKSRKFEVRYNHTIALSDYDVEIIGRADLVETLANGSLAITDFKTGKPPSNRQVLSGLSPQLPLLGAMAALSAEEDKPTGPPADFFYVGFGSGGGVQQVQDGRKPVDAQELAGAALAGLKDLLTSFAKEDTPYLSGPRIQFQRGWSDYDQLSRRQEWADPGHTGAEDYS